METQVPGEEDPAPSLHEGRRAHPRRVVLEEEAGEEGSVVPRAGSTGGGDDESRDVGLRGICLNVIVSLVPAGCDRQSAQLRRPRPRWRVVVVEAPKSGREACAHPKAPAAPLQLIRALLQQPLQLVLAQSSRLRAHRSVVHAVLQPLLQRHVLSPLGVVSGVLREPPALRVRLLRSHELEDLPLHLLLPPYHLLLQIGVHEVLYDRYGHGLVPILILERRAQQSASSAAADSVILPPPRRPSCC